MVIIFFFKQKTAYEMRISDWSPDVCSSDLSLVGERPRADHADVQFQVVELVAVLGDQADAGIGPAGVGAVVLDELALFDALRGENFLAQRSEEHTSELQSLMRISYAVFCLKKKNTQVMQQNDKWMYTT